MSNQQTFPKFSYWARLIKNLRKFHQSELEMNASIDELPPRQCAFRSLRRLLHLSILRLHPLCHHAEPLPRRWILQCWHLPGSPRHDGDPGNLLNSPGLRPENINRASALLPKLAGSSRWAGFLFQWGF